MSSQVNTYVMFGVILDYKEAHATWDHDDAAHDQLYDVLDPYIDNAFKPETNPKDGLTVLYDGMNGEYIAIGHVIAKTDNHQHFEKPISAIGDLAVGLTDFLPALQELLEFLGLGPATPRSALGWHIISHYR